MELGRFPAGRSRTRVLATGRDKVPETTDPFERKLRTAVESAFARDVTTNAVIVLMRRAGSAAMEDPVELIVTTGFRVFKPPNWLTGDTDAACWFRLDTGAPIRDAPATLAVEVAVRRAPDATTGETRDPCGATTGAIVWRRVDVTGAER